MLSKNALRGREVTRWSLCTLCFAGLAVAAPGHAQDVYPVLDTEFYGWMNDDVRQAYGENSVWLWWHWGTAGRHEVRTSSPAFDTAFYLHQHPDVAAHYGADIGGVVGHFIDRGVFEGRSASIAFDPVWYLSAHPDVAEHFGDTRGLGVLVRQPQSPATSRATEADTGRNQVDGAE